MTYRETSSLFGVDRGWVKLDLLFHFCQIGLISVTYSYYEVDQMTNERSPKTGRNS